MSSRTSPQTGVAISQKEHKISDFKIKMPENLGDCHASVRTGSQ